MFRLVQNLLYKYAIRPSLLLRKINRILSLENGDPKLYDRQKITCSVTKQSSAIIWVSNKLKFLRAELKIFFSLNFLIIYHIIHYNFFTSVKSCSKSNLVKSQKMSWKILLKFWPFYFLNLNRMLISQMPSLFSGRNGLRNYENLLIQNLTFWAAYEMR